jgi:hypothetical protein
MISKRPTIVATVICLMLQCAALSWGQTPHPRAELLRLVPKDFALCFVLTDLRNHAAKWEKSTWIKSLKESALGQAFVAAPEFKRLLAFGEDLKTHLGIDWPTLRDDVLGDAVVFAYQPPSADAQREEQGVLLLHARRPEVLTRLVDSFNKAQTDSGDLKSLQTLEHRGIRYFCRSGRQDTHYYLLKGPLFAYAAKEESLKHVIEQYQGGDGAPSPLAASMQRAGSNNALVSVWLNPRALDADLRRSDGMAGPRADMKLLVKYWMALDAVVVSVTASEGFEFKVSLLAREKDLPAPVSGLFTEAPRPSALWRHFPDNAIVRMVAPLEGKALAEALVDMAPSDTRLAFQRIVQPVAALAGIDLARDFASHVGPDFGLCILPATDGKGCPQVIAALAFHSSAKDAGTDRAFYRAVPFLAGLALVDYNRRNPDDPIRLETTKRQDVEITYLANDKLFTAGFQPACALKDGYLLLMTSPETVTQFAKTTAPATDGSVRPLLCISAKELAKVLRQHRQRVVNQIAASNQIAEADAAQRLDNTLSVLDLVDRVEINQQSGAGQFSLVLRVSPAAK